jgi:CheY-like chemotaxis protein
VTAVTRVLVVDDNEDSRAIYSEMLSLAGHGVVTAADGAEAIAYALRVPFDLIILDLCLPKVDGIRVIKEVRSSPVARYTPIVTVSAGDELMHRQALAAGADLALEKPCLPDELRDAVRTFLNADRGRERGAAPARTKRS